MNLKLILMTGLTLTSTKSIPTW